MDNILLVIHLFIALALIGIVLLQQGKGADAGAGFGGGASGTVFGSRGSASFLTKMTGVLAVLFFVTSMTLQVLSAKSIDPSAAKSVADLAEQAAEKTTEIVPPAAESKAADEPAAPAAE